MVHEGGQIAESVAGKDQQGLDASFQLHDQWTGTTRLLARSQISPGHKVSDNGNKSDGMLEVLRVTDVTVMHAGGRPIIKQNKSYWLESNEDRCQRFT